MNVAAFRVKKSHYMQMPLPTCPAEGCSSISRGSFQIHMATAHEILNDLQVTVTSGPMHWSPTAECAFTSLAKMWRAATSFYQIMDQGQMATASSPMN
mmetsp:Transcript_27892/g.39913  ORF Transcript_27892/g.39913 Transcript_27892/m.39913 type:complete len:98 (+) Transcript_27892:493-786(+)